ncbi:Hint domain-containing protein [Carnimonas bestiolae]|uniref:Hint domain-containing protein n=1 Tax=Carnimonas bestiolae TaxID=3402172 RepID=UPI003EDBEB2E
MALSRSEVNDTLNEISDKLDSRARFLNKDSYDGMIGQVRELTPDLKADNSAYLLNKADSTLDKIDQTANDNDVLSRTEKLRVHRSVEATSAYVQKYGCFTEGTLISTPNGDVKIEALKEGDLVNTLSGPQPLKWIGQRTLTNMASWSDKEKRNNYPVHICAHALGAGIPSQDVTFSAWHHVYVNGVLARAMDLINGMTIYQQQKIDQIKYFHLELDEFDVIMAHGVYSESYTDNGINRGFYDNAVISLQPTTEQRGGMSPRPGFTVVRPNHNAGILTAIKQQLEIRAEEMHTATANNQHSA